MGHERRSKQAPRNEPFYSADFVNQGCVFFLFVGVALFVGAGLTQLSPL
jgi:hypothetical protein